jgi:hypothetical protein
MYLNGSVVFLIYDLFAGWTAVNHEIPHPVYVVAGPIIAFMIIWIFNKSTNYSNYSLAAI